MNVDPPPTLKQHFANAFGTQIKNVEKTLSDQRSSSGSFGTIQHPVPTPKSGSSSEAMVPTLKSETDLNGKSARSICG